MTKFSLNAETVLKKRYLKNGETPDEMLKRVAKNIASIEKDKKYENIFYTLMSDLKFLPNSPTLLNARLELQQLSACFVLPVNDSLNEIFESVKNTALIHKTGGGTGFNFSKLRPKDDYVNTTKGISSGAVSFMEVFDKATEVIKQGGVRRGANMGILNVHHPDILEFIDIKNNLQKLTNFNISVAITDEFMKAVKENKEYNLYNPRTNEVVITLKAKEVFDKIVKNAWQTGEPGIVFIDTVNSGNTLPKLGRLESTNPCGEQPLFEYESCNLGSINLSKFVKDKKIDYVDLEETIKYAVRFLDNIIDLNKYPLKEIEKMTKANRKIGLGIMGFADLLVLMGIPYGSDNSITIAENIMRFINEKANYYSVELSKEKGNFKNINKSIFKERRNATVTTIAPTGTISIIADASSGIEPYFALAYKRNVMDTQLIELNKYLLQELQNIYNDEDINNITNQIIKTGNIKTINFPNYEKYKEKIDYLKSVFITSHDVTPEQHIKIQSAFQKHTENAVSKTINFSKNATIEDVEKAYLLAYDLNCKGITIYRDGSRDSQVLTIENKETEKENMDDKIQNAVSTPIHRPEILNGKTIVVNTGCGKMYVTLNYDDTGKVFEIFTSIGKAGGCAKSQSEAIGRLIALNLRSNVDIRYIVKQLKGISCHQTYGFGSNKVLSCSDAIAKAIEKIIDLDTGYILSTKKENIETTILKTGACAECGSPLEYKEGCLMCSSCGYSKCS